MTTTQTAVREMTTRKINPAVRVLDARRTNASRRNTSTSAARAAKAQRRQQVRGFEVVLSFPASELMQNRSAGKHWSYAHEAKTVQRQEAYLLTRQAINISGFEAKVSAAYRVEMTFCPPDKRARDVSNLHAAMKAALDGIADAMGVNDKTFKQHAQSEGNVHHSGRVVVKVSEIQ